jgi:hypothetical protein
VVMCFWTMRLMLGIMLVTIAIGTVAELTPPLVGRCCDLMDWVANVVGVSVVGVSYMFWICLIRKCKTVRF